MVKSSKPVVAVFAYLITFGLAFFVFLRGFQLSALGLVVFAWALLVLWLRQGGR